MEVDELCGDVYGEPYAFEVECILRKGHLGDHYAVASWPQWAPRPPGEVAQNKWLSAIWGKALEGALRASILRPVEPKERVISRDELTFRHEPHPDLPGVVVPVLDQEVRMDSATGAMDWD